PTDAAKPIRDRHPPESPDLADRRIVVSLSERVDRAPVDAVVEEGVLVALGDRNADRVPVELGQVVVRSAWAEEDRIWEPGVVVDVWKGGERGREVGPDLVAELVHVGVGRRVAALVARLGV